MKEAIVSIVNETGLHARPASDFIKIVTKFNSKTTLIKGEKTANAKSMLNILTLGLSKGSQVTIRTEGADEEEALAAMVDFISNLKE